MSESSDNETKEQSEQNEDFIVKLRGLPWSATEKEIKKFLGDEGILKVHLTLSKEGRPSGEAFVELESEEDLERAVEKDKEHMGSRYIEVFQVNKAEMEWVVKRSGNSYSSNQDGCVRLRGLPFGCSKEEIAQFFTGLEIVPNGITLLTDYSGRSSGEAYVQFANKDVAERALLKHREKIGHRYIEIFRSNLAEVNSALGFDGPMGPRGGPPMRGPPSLFGSRPGPYDRGDRFGGPGFGRFPPRGSRSFKGANMGNSISPWLSPDPWLPQNGGGPGPRGMGGPPMGGPPMGGPMGGMGGPMGGPMGGMGGDIGFMGGGGGFRDDFDEPWGNRPVVQTHCIHMRGLPFKATQKDIAEFFRPIIPMTIHILSEPSGRPSGEADVTFATHEDAVRAMSKDKSHMQHRYIELFLNSSGVPMGGPGRFRR